MMVQIPEQTLKKLNKSHSAHVRLLMAVRAMKQHMGDFQQTPEALELFDAVRQSEDVFGTRTEKAASPLTAGERRG